MLKNGYKKYLLGATFYSLTAMTVYALPFSVATKAGTSLPTALNGATANAFYTVTNNTGTQRNANFVLHLPPHVTQITTGTYADTCGNTFDLAPNGAPGSSCTLQLLVSGAVDAKDPNPANHLFVCARGGLACAGTAQPLNVNTAPVSPIAYVGDSANSRLYYCNMTSIGLSGCQTTGSGFANPTDLSFAAYGNNIYIVNNANNVSGAGSVVSCPINANNTLGTCATVVTGLSAPVFFISNPNPAYPFMYLSNYNNSTITYARVEGNGSLDNFVTATGQIPNPSGIAFNKTGNLAYVSSDNGGGQVYICPVNVDGTFGTCTVATQDFNDPRGLTFNSTYNLLYVANSGMTGLHANNMSVCTIDANGAIGACTEYAPGFMGPFSASITHDGTHVYIPNSQGAYISYCEIQATNGGISNCIDAYGGVTFVQPTDVLFR